MSTNQILSSIILLSKEQSIQISYLVLSFSFFLLYFILTKLSKKVSSKDYINSLNAEEATEKYIKYLTRQANKGLKEDEVPITKAPIVSKAFPRILVVYATQSNTSKSFAEQLKKDNLFKINIKNISEIENNDFLTNLVIVFLVSTYGEGEPTDDALDFFKRINSFDKGSCAYCVFGLGSTKYEKFCQTGKNLDIILSKSNNRLIEFTSGDDSLNIRKDFEVWKEKFYQSIINLFTDDYLLKNKDFIIKNKLDQFTNDDKEYEIRLSEYKELKTTCVDSFSIGETDYDYQIKTYLSGVYCDVENVVELRQQKKNGSTLKVQYNSTNLKYNVGDNIGVYPANSEADVLYVIKRLKLDPETYIHILKNKMNLQKRITLPTGVKIREIIDHIIDLNTKPSKQIVTDLSKYCTDIEDYDSITQLIKTWDHQEYNIVDILRKYESINLSFVEFYDICPKITPRFYTVASSSNLMPNKLELVISLVSFKKENKLRLGLTSNYYSKLEEKFTFKSMNQDFTKTRLIVRESGFKLPFNSSSPVVMICTGTGIAPYISFLQELQSLNSKRDTLLLFGSKNVDCDFIYKSELSEFLTSGYLKSLYSVFSRDLTYYKDNVMQNKQCRYVQDVIEEEKDLISKLIIKQNGYVFICGGVSMGQDVTKKLETLFGISFLRQLEHEKRLFKELWG